MATGPASDTLAHGKDAAATTTLTPERGPDLEQVVSDDNSQQDEQSSLATDAVKDSDATNPPLPDEAIPPLPSEEPPAAEDDGWAPLWDDNAQRYYFHNRFTGTSQWENPRVPNADAQVGALGTGNITQPQVEQSTKRPHGGYDPSIHGSYDPTASYALEAKAQEEADAATASLPPGVAPGTTDYTATGTFNRFTGKWQASTLNPENYNDENKSKRQMNAFFDVETAANSHNGRSLKAERSAKKLTKQELKAFKEKRRDKKEERRRAWLLD